jgi:hypothetical protein
VTGSPYSIVPSGASGGTFNSTNYTVACQDGTLTLTPAGLTVSANNASRMAGLPNPPFRGTMVGLQNDDNITAMYQCDATASSPAGTYDIVPTLNDPSSKVGNYAVTINKGVLTVMANPVISNPTIVGRTLRFTVPTAVGSTYVLEYKNLLTDVDWAVAQALAGTGDVVTFTDDTTSSPARFYRIRVE